MPVANPYVVAVVPLKISVCGGFANVRSGSVTPGANQIGLPVVRNASSAIASAVTSSPDSTLISVIPPNKPPLPNTVLDCAVASLNPVQGGTPLTCVTPTAVTPVTLPISMIST